MYGRPIEMNFRFDRPAFDKLYLQGKLNVAKADTVKVSMKAEGDNDDGQFFSKTWDGGSGGYGIGMFGIREGAKTSLKWKSRGVPEIFKNTQTLPFYEVSYLL
jgi:hypothetical protein